MAGDSPLPDSASDKLVCPKTTDVPPPLLNEFMDYLHDRSHAPVLWMPHLKFEGVSDYYKVNNDYYVGLINKTIPIDKTLPPEINFIRKMGPDAPDQGDHYSQGKRTDSTYLKTIEAQTTSGTAKFDETELVTEITGSTYKQGASSVTEYQATFDAAGKRTSYKTGSSWDKLQPTECIDK